MTLIELLVGLTLGLLVVLAAVASLMIVRGSSHTMSDSAALEQQATLAMLQIGQQLSQTGAYNAYAAGTDPNTGVPGSDYPAFDPGTSTNDTGSIQFDIRPIGVAQELSTFAIFGKDADDTTPTTDTLYISYAKANDGSPSAGCAGLKTDPLTTGGAARSVSIFTVDTKTNSLTCHTDSDTSKPVPIAANVVDMRVSYLSVDTKGNVTYYATAKDVNDAPNTWASINGVQICLELVGDTTQAVQPTFKGCQDQDKPANGRIHRIVRNTFYLRNPLQAS